MKNREVIEKILAYHPQLPGYQGCDEWKTGDPEEECTGIVTALVPTVNVIRKTIELGANLLIVHEPLFYTSADKGGWYEDFPNAVYEEKKKLIDDHGISIWRDHDHIHMHQPDGIFAGVLKYLGWEDYATADLNTGAFGHYIVDLPEEITLEALCCHLMERIGLNGLRYVGNPGDKVRSLAMVGHLYPMDFGMKHHDGSPAEYSVQIIKLLEQRVDVILPGEIIDWTVVSYIRDALQQGRKKAMINLGHLNWEELGMKYARQWLEELINHTLPVTYVPSEDMYRFFRSAAPEKPYIL